MKPRHWVQASRPLAQVNLALPVLLGQAAAWHQGRLFELRWLAAALLWTVLDHLLIVFGNDWADRDADGTERSLLSGGSGVLVQGKIRPGQLRAAMWTMVALLLAYASVLSFHERPWTAAYTLAAISLLWAYSFEPLRLSYRGGGELLQGVGLGMGLPSLGYYLQGAGFVAPIWALLPATCLGVCGNILTALPDIEADRAAKKKTWAVRRGFASAKAVALMGIGVSAMAVATQTPGLPKGFRWALAVIPLFATGLAFQSRRPFPVALRGSIALQSLVLLWILAMATR
jgi:1,4-dihydroxy-2-naphthoate octaprenyltransferase